MSELITWSPGVSLEEIERQVILKAFRHFRGNKTQTALALGISIRTIDNKLEKFEAESKAREEQANLIREREIDFQRRARGIAVQQPNGQIPPKVEQKPKSKSR